MSLPSIEVILRRVTHRVRAYVGTSEVVVDVLGGRRRPSLCAVREPIESTEGPDAVLDALDRAVNRASVGQGGVRGLTCDVVVADAWVVYDVVALDVMQVPPDSASAVIASTLADVAGVPPEALDVRWRWQRDGRGAFAMAIPRDLLAQLRMRLEQHGLSVRSVTGEFVAVYDAQRERMTGARVVFAVVRSAGTQIALLSDGVIRATRFEMGRNGATALLGAVTAVMRARGEDTAAAIQYLIDTGSPDSAAARAQVSAAGWLLVNPPPWAAVQ